MPEPLHYLHISDSHLGPKRDWTPLDNTLLYKNLERFVEAINARSPRPSYLPACGRLRGVFFGHVHRDTQTVSKRHPLHQRRQHLLPSQPLAPRHRDQLRHLPATRFQRRHLSSGPDDRKIAHDPPDLSYMPTPAAESYPRDMELNGKRYIAHSRRGQTQQK